MKIKYERPVLKWFDVLLEAGIAAGSGKIEVKDGEIHYYDWDEEKKDVVIDW